jgi:O-antigen/teichoic acid export membrane protein
MQCLALRAFLGGLENVGTIDFRRDLRFNRFFAFNVYPKAISFVLTLTVALIWRNYWALVVGILTGQFVRLVLSYTMHSHRPHFTLSAAREIWSFSIWTFIRTIGGYLNVQIDQIAVGGMSGSATMGRYSVACDVAASPSTEINEPMVAVVYPVLSRLLDDRQAMRDVYMNTLAWSAVICVATGTGVALVADDMVDLVLGPKWTGIGPLMAWLAVGAGISGLSSGSYALFDALGKPHVGARMIWTRTFVLAAAVLPIAFLTKSLIDVAISRTIAATLFLPGLYIVVGRLLSITFADYVRRLWRPFAAAACMAAGVLTFNHLVAWQGNVRLFADVFLGAAVFVSTILGFWIMSGRPTGPEADFLATVRRYVPV